MTPPAEELPLGRVEPQQPPRIPSGDLLAVVGLVVGSLVLPVVGWLVGLVLLWRSRSWTTLEKLVGTLVWPGGLLLPLALPFLPVGAQLMRTPALALTVITVLVVTPMVVGGWLLLRARERAADRAG
jgi:hypothetical protein